jgi:hypothetical protein
MDSAGEELLALLEQIGFSPEYPVNENSPVEDYFNVITDGIKDHPGKYAIVLIYNQPVALNLKNSKKQLSEMIKHHILLLAPQDKTTMM